MTTIKPAEALQLAKKHYKNYIEQHEGAKVFNYYKFTNYCCELSSDTDNGGEGGGYLLRDLAMCEMDTNFNPARPFKFLGMDTLD